VFFGRAVAESVVPLLGQAGQGEDHDAVVRQVALRFEAAVEESSVTVSLETLKPSSEPLQIPVDKETRIDRFLNQIYFALSPVVKPFTYDQAWTLVDDQGNEYTEMGTRWAEQQNLKADNRPVIAVGIEPGTRLMAVPKSRVGRRNQSPIGQ
jgi:hypothetical protein